MKTWFCLLGRERELAMAELAALSEDAASLEQHGSLAVGSGSAPDWTRMGSIQRAGKILGTLDVLDAHKISSLLTEIPTTGKLHVGVSVLGVKKNQHQKLAMQIKSALKSRSQSIRIITSTEGPVLNAAQVIHNNLTGPQGFELVIWEHRRTWWVGRTTWVQDIDGYTHRDRERPIRDARVGMLPPKLAQTLINLAQPQKDDLIYDPFCGTGVVLMEAALMGFAVSGSDLSDRMVDATKQNLSWLAAQRGSAIPSSITEADAQAVQFSPELGPKIRIVGEGYLGTPLEANAHKEDALAQIATLDQLYTSVLQNFAQHDQSGRIATIVLALPFWHIDNHEYRLNFLDSLDRIGYTFDQFAPHAKDWLTYRRDDQRVGRMIVRLKKRS